MKKFIKITVRREDDEQWNKCYKMLDYQAWVSSEKKESVDCSEEEAWQAWQKINRGCGEFDLLANRETDYFCTTIEK